MQRKQVQQEQGIKAVVVMSGGQDSALCAALAARKHGPERVAAVTFRYGQRHSLETKYARFLARHFSLAMHKVVKLDFFDSITSSALLSKNAKIERAGKCPNTVVEGRNAFFLMAAAVWAKSLGADEVWTGVSQTDYSGYPDCRAVFVRAQEKAARLALDFPVKFKAPFLRKTKAQEWALADSMGLLDLIRENTLTCYNGIPGDGCGKCPACILRRKGLEEYLGGAVPAKP